MKRTQLYLDDDLWKALHTHARREKTTISDLVRRAARERYMGGREKRAKAMQAFVGVWKDRSDIGDTEEYVRNLRDDHRLERLKEQ
jgi:hypothetical protein